jgi:hypothetical protein
VPGSIFTHKATNREINSITSVYYIESYYRAYYKTERPTQRKQAPHHRQMTEGSHAYKKSSSKNSSSSEQQSIAAIYKKYGKCKFIKYSASVGNNGMQAYNKKGLTSWFNCRESI